jgi:hypothetical protein
MAVSVQMHRIRQYFLMGLLVCASPLAVHAQWGLTVIEHDWRFRIAGRPYGLVQQVDYVGARIGGTRTTRVCFGASSISTRFPAACVAMAILLPAAVIGIIVVRGFFSQEMQV